MRLSQRHLRRIAFTDHLEADDEVGEEDVALTTADAGGEYPRQKFRVALDVSDKVEQLPRRVRQDAPLGMRSHAAYPAASVASRARRSFAKSSPAK